MTTRKTTIITVTDRRAENGRSEVQGYRVGAGWAVHRPVDWEQGDRNRWAVTHLRTGLMTVDGRRKSEGVAIAAGFDLITTALGDAGEWNDGKFINNRSLHLARSLQSYVRKLRAQPDEALVGTQVVPIYRSTETTIRLANEAITEEA